MHRTHTEEHQVATARTKHSFSCIISFLPALIPRKMTPHPGSQLSPRGGQSRGAWIRHGRAERSRVTDWGSKSPSFSIVNYHFPKTNRAPGSQASC